MLGVERECDVDRRQEDVGVLGVHDEDEERRDDDDSRRRRSSRAHDSSTARGVRATPQDRVTQMPNRCRENRRY